MKKKILTVFLALVAALCLCVGISACDDKKSANTGDNGTQTEQPGGSQSGNQGNQGGGSQTTPGGGQGGTQKPDEGQGSEQKPDEGGQGGSQTAPGGSQTPHVHAYGDWDIISAATHTQTGIRRKYCSCGEYIEEAIPKTTAHEYGNWNTTREATHLQEGEKQRTCPCGAVEKQSIPKTTAHEYGNWIVTEEASCTQTGYQYHECPCGHTESEVIPMKAHSYTDCVCDMCGAIEPGAVEVKVCIDNQYQNSLYTSASNGYQIQLPDYWEDYRYFDGWYANTEYMEPLTGDETYQTSSAIYGRWIPFLNYKVTVNKGEATIVKCNSTTATAVVVPSGCGDSNVNYPITSIAAEAFKGMTMIRWLIILSPMRTIGSSAFEGCNSMKKVVLPDSVTEIGDWAFCNCSSIEKLEIPDSVTEIGSGAFYNCNGLKSVIWNAENCTQAGSYSYNADYTIFRNCTNLNAVTFGGNVKTIPAYAFYKCSALTGDLKIPDSVTSIGEYVFLGCNGLESVTIGSGMTSIGNYAFKDCNGLESVTIGAGVTSIGEYAFYNCSGLTGELKIPDSVTLIGDKAFYGCSALTGDLKIPDSVTSIGDWAFYGCGGIESVTIGSGMTSIGSSAFYNCSGLKSVIWNAENCTRAGSYSYDDLIFSKCTNLSTVTFGENVKTIPAYAFKNCSGLTNVTIGDSVTSIGSSAFYNCDGLTGELKIPDGVTSIGDEAFYDCDGLTGTLKIPDSVTLIGDGAFASCGGLTGELKIPESVTSIGEKAFYYCGGIESVTIGNGVTSIGEKAFYYTAYYNDNSNWENGTVLYIGNYLIEAIDTNSGIYSIRDNTKVIADRAFSGCGSLMDIRIPDSVTTIGRYAFAACGRLTDIEIPDSVTTIGQYAFYNCRDLRIVKIGSGVTSIGGGAFENCDFLSGIVFDDPYGWYCNGKPISLYDSVYAVQLFRENRYSSWEKRS